MHRRSLIQLTLAAALTPIAARAQSPWRTIFDGTSLDGWTPVGAATWTLKDGAVEGAGAMGYLMTRDSYKDVDIRAEVWVSPDANSGIFIRCSSRTQVTAANAYEVNIFDTRPDPTYGTGAIVNVAKVDPMPKAGGKWNLMEINARGDRFTVTVNGTRTVDNVQNADHAEGPFALQYGAGVVKFRKVEIRTA